MRRARMGGGYSDAHAILAEETAMPVRFNTASAGASAGLLSSCHCSRHHVGNTRCDQSVMLAIMCGSPS